MEARMLEICAGWDDREVVGYNLCQFSAIRRTSEPIRFVPLMEKVLRYKGLYKRPEEWRNGQRWCLISDAPMSTAFANSRFLSPWLANGSSWILFCDFADMLFLADPAELFELADAKCAVMVVKGRHVPDESEKMDHQRQTTYPRKNWSSVILWNCRHPGTVRLTLDMVNSLPGRDLHAFSWLEDHEIGELPASWNHLVGVDRRKGPKLLHFTKGTPETGVDDEPWASVWRQELAIMDATRANIRMPIERSEL
jgi:hypothetical protein